jgi:elongation factor G
MVAGDIVAVAGLKVTRTGDTLCRIDKPLLLEKLDFPEPVISVAIEPKTKADEDKLGEALSKLELEDPSFRVTVNEETGQRIISGMGELHLEIIVDRLLREHSASANVGKPQVSYKETITLANRAEGKFIKQAAGKGQYGHVILEVSPGERGSGFCFINKTSLEIVPKEFVPFVEEGIKLSLESGVLSGYPVVDVSVKLIGGSHHEVDSTDIAFKMAASMAVNDALRSGASALLEPIMFVEVTVPDEFLSSIISDLNGRRGKVIHMHEKAGLKIVEAFAPLAQLFGYATDIRSLSQGRAHYSMEFKKYEMVPAQIAQAILNRYR